MREFFDDGFPPGEQIPLHGSRAHGRAGAGAVADPCPPQRPADSILRAVGVEYRGCVLEPRSEWKMTPAGGFRAARAISSAAVIRLARMCAATAQPMILRE
jgi:hypothetical protein